MSEELATLRVAGIRVRYRKGSPGEAAAPAIARRLRRARRRLAPLAPGRSGAELLLMLADPFPDPDRPGEYVTSGTMVDAERGEIWMVVTAERPGEAPERALALLLGAGLPAAAELEVLLEGYGLHVAGGSDPDAALRGVALPALTAAEGESRAAMARSFVAYLVDREGEDAFVRFLHSAQPGHVDAAARGAFGTGLADLEEAWSRKLAGAQPKIATTAFLRLTLRYLRPHLARQIEISCYMLLGLAFTMAFPFVLRTLLDTAIPSGEYSQVAALLVVLGAALGVSMVADLRRSYVSAGVSASIVRKVRGEMFERLQALSALWFSRSRQGDVLSRLLSDVGQFESGVSQTLREGSFQILSLVVSSIVLLLLEARLALIVFVAVPIVAVIYRLMAKGARRRSIAVQEEVAGLLNVAAENYGAQPVVKAFALESRERDRFSRASDRLYARQLRLQLFTGVFGLSVNAVVTTLRMVILGLGAWLVMQGDITIGTLVAFTGVVGQVLSPVGVLTGLGQQMQMATGSLERINEVLTAVPDVTDDEGAPDLPRLEGEIRLSHVGFSYTPERKTLEDINCVIAAGQRVAFVGPTGAGKSSLLQLVQRFYDVDEGAVCVDGVDVRRVTISSLRAQMGVVFQDSILFNTTIRENIALAKPGATDEEVEAAARAAELHDAVMAMPNRYDTTVGERGGRLSGGQRQRLALARALIRDPAVLLLDEATSALDPRTERLIAQTLDRVGQGRTTIAVTHRIMSIAGYDRIFVMSDGRIVEQGTHDELLALGGLYADLWSEQTGAKVSIAPPFDVIAALGRVSVFASADAADLRAAADRVERLDLAAGSSLAEGAVPLAIVRVGRARVVVSSRDGAPTVTAHLGPGDAFGVAALLGARSGAVLEAVDDVELLVLGDDSMRVLAARPAVGAALVGPHAGPIVPGRGRRLVPTTIALPTGERLPPAYARAPEVLHFSQAVPFGLPREFAWGGATGRGVHVAVLDSGIESDHPDLEGCVDIDNCRAFVVDGEGNVTEHVGQPGDAVGHGTAVAGIIHALAPRARITSVQVLGAGLPGNAAALRRGLEWAIDEGFDIINLSLGTTRHGFALDFYELCDRAYFNGSFVVTAANNRTRPTFPSMYASVTSVACGPTDDPFHFDWNPEPPTEFLARGIDVDVAWAGGGRRCSTGNSYAAAHVAGIAALIKSAHPDLRPFQLKMALWATSANVRSAQRRGKMPGNGGGAAESRGE